MSKQDEVYTEITERMTALIRDNGTVPWSKGWSVAGYLPANAQSKRPYRGFNSLWLGIMQQANGYTSPFWTTYNAALKSCGWDGEGGRAGAAAWRAANPGYGVRKGEKSTTAILWKWLTVEDKKDPTKEKRVPMLRTFPIFNVDQVDGLEIAMPERPNVGSDEGAEALLAGYTTGPTVEHMVSDQAFYSPLFDRIVMPLREQFATVEAYYETRFHEEVHGTGHKSRLNRLEDGWTERRDYALEELVAEIGSAMLMQQAGMTPDMPQMAGYVQSWLRALENDHSMIVKAAQRAQKACDHILGYVYEAEQEEAA